LGGTAESERFTTEGTENFGVEAVAVAWRCRGGGGGVPHLRCSGLLRFVSRPLRAGLTYAAPPALVRRKRIAWWGGSACGGGRGRTIIARLVLWRFPPILGWIC